MSVGFILLVHTSLDRAAQVARHLATSGSPVVVHIDQRVGADDAQRLRSILRIHDQIKFCPRFRCDWGTWSIVDATQAAAEVMLDEFPDIGHVFLASGSCMPLRPMPELIRYLADHGETDFIESVTTSDVRWTMGGLDQERFTLYFPFAWKRHRWLFDRFVSLQRLFGVQRKKPVDLDPHLGSQWWCLTRKTLHRILNDARRPQFEKYFRSLWIPDEAYFQTLVRRHSDKIEGRSLTLSKFDDQGRPYTFYDDHLELLRRSDCFFARKIWHNADRLYRSFLGARSGQPRVAEPDPGKIDRLFAKAVDLRTQGRPGLVMQSKFPNAADKNRQTASPYRVLQGFDRIFDDFENWLGDATATRVHGRLFHPEGAEFADGAQQVKGGLTSNPYLRDYDRAAFLRNLIWNARGEKQHFMYGPEDGVEAWTLLANDPNARISVITGAWTIGLFAEDLPFCEGRRRAALLQQQEVSQLEILRRPETLATVQVLNLAEYLANPMEPLQEIVGEAVTTGQPYLGEAPTLTRMVGLEQFLRQLRNAGMQPYLAGHFVDAQNGAKDIPKRTAAKTLLVR